jgi:hypothetical protein
LVSSPIIRVFACTLPQAQACLGGKKYPGLCYKNQEAFWNKKGSCFHTNPKKEHISED